MIIATHDGKFHADDVMAVSLLKQLNPEAKIVRSRDPNVLNKADVVVDVGGKCDPDSNRFDHHMADYDQQRDNGIMYSSLGLVWRKYGESFCGDQEVADMIDYEVIAAIDAHDNGQKTSETIVKNFVGLSFSDVIDWFNPNSNEDLSYDNQFDLAVDLANQFWLRILAKYRHRQASRERFMQAYQVAEDKQIISLPAPMPFVSFCKDLPEVKFVIIQDENGRYYVRTVPRSNDHLRPRQSPPKEWWGLEGGDLKKVSGIDGAIFCHRSHGWIMAASSYDDALLMAKQSLLS